MSGSETGLIASREAFGVGLQKSPVVQSQPVIQNMRLAFSADGTAVYKPVPGASPPYNQSPPPVGSEAPAGGATVPQGPALNMNASGGESMKRKRGRPRKYGPDGTMGLALTPVQPPAALNVAQSGGSGGAFPSPPAAAPSSAGAVTQSGSKKARGRPPGSSKKHQMEALGSAGLGFTPHIITVKAGEVHSLNNLLLTTVGKFIFMQLNPYIILGIFSFAIKYSLAVCVNYVENIVGP